MKEEENDKKDTEETLVEEIENIQLGEEENNNDDNAMASTTIITEKKSRKILWLSLAIFVLVAIIVGFCIINKMNTKVYSNITLGDKDVSGMTSDEVTSYLLSLENGVKNLSVKITQGSNIITEVTAQEIDLEIDSDKTLKKVMDYGRNQNALKNNINILMAIVNGHKEDIVYKYSEDKLDVIIQEIRGSIDSKVINDSYSFDENKYNIIITKGTSGNDINIQEFKRDVINTMINKIESYELKVTTQAPQAIDVDIVYSKVARQAQDAYVDETVKPIKFVKHVVGIDFNKDELREILAEEGNKKEGKIIKFKVKITQPKVKLADIKWDLYEDKITSTTTYFTSSDANRSSNLKVGLSILQGTVVMPGEIFSFNNTMGDCGLSSRGFKPAATFRAGQVVSEVGGGICQVASTLYNSALKANLQIVRRSNHALPVGYVKPSLDATVYYPYVDFKFKNTRSYPIKIVTNYNSSGRMSITIMGTFEEQEYNVVLTSLVIGSIASKKEYVNDNTLASGTTKVLKKGTNGYTSCAYRTVKLGDKVISKTLLSNDSYKGTITRIAVGTKVVVPVTVPTVVPAQSVTP